MEIRNDYTVRQWYGSNCWNALTSNVKADLLDPK